MSEIIFVSTANNKAIAGYKKAHAGSNEERDEAIASSIERV